MSTFAYVGRTRQGSVKKGELTAKTRDEAVDQLRKQNVVVTSLEEKSGKGGKFKFSLGSGLTDKDLVVFTRQFGTMINAGLPLIQCLDILATQSENKVLRETVGDVKISVEGGSTFSDALRKHPKVFDDLYVNMIHAGEVGGLLDTILTRLAKHIEKAMKLKGQIKSAMVYPIAIMGVAVIVITVLMVWVIPIFAKMFAEMSGGKVGLAGTDPDRDQRQQFFPKLHRSHRCRHCGINHGIKRYYKTTKGRIVIDRLLLKVPVVGRHYPKSLGSQIHTNIGHIDHKRRPVVGRAWHLRARRLAIK